MKRIVATSVVVLAALVLAILFGAPKVQTYNSSAAIAAQPAAPMAVPMPNRCPRIHEAIESLRQTEQELRAAGHDFCGRKVEAMRTVHEAIEQLRAAENCDRCR